MPNPSSFSNSASAGRGRARTGNGRRSLAARRVAAALWSLVAVLGRSGLGGAGLPAEAAAADAQNPTDASVAPLIVTARRIEENIQKVPFTVTALTPEM